MAAALTYQGAVAAIRKPFVTDDDGILRAIGGGVGDQGIEQAETMAQAKGGKIMQGSLAVRFGGPVQDKAAPKLLHPLLFVLVLTTLNPFHNDQA